MPDRPVHVNVLGEADWLAVVQRLDLRELLGARLHRVSQRVHQALPPSSGHRGPGAVSERRTRRRYRVRHVLCAGVGHLRDLAARCGVERRKRAPVGRLEALRANQQALRTGDERARGVSQRVGEGVRACGVDCGGHSGSLQVFRARMSSRLQHDLKRLAPVIQRVGLGRIVEGHVVGDERAWVEQAGGHHRHHAIYVGDHVGVARIQLQ